MTSERMSRRGALAGAAVTGVAVPLLAACGGDDSGPPAADATPTPTESETPTAPTSSATTEAPPAEDETSEPPDPQAPALVATADVPVGGGVVLAKRELVVTQPRAGRFRCFTAVCTHKGCLVGSVADGTISCPCHGSRFSATDGSVQGGPASSGLEEVPVVVEDGAVRRA